MSSQDVPLISILINNYNYGRFLGHAIQSALDQTYPHLEVIVVDDGSTDNSRQVIASFGDRIIPILKANGGQTSALNAGFAASRGVWIHLLDADDLFHPDKVQQIAGLATEFPEAGMIAHELDYCESNSNPITFAPPYILERKLVDDRMLARKGKLSVSLPATSGLCVRRDVLQRILPMPEQMLVSSDNYLKWVTLSLYPVLLVPQAYATQRIHGANLYTIAHEKRGVDAALRLAAVNATVAFHMKQQHAHLSKLAWKQYGRVLHSLWSCRSKDRKATRAEISSRHSVVEHNASCYFYVAAAFTKAYMEELVRRYRTVPRSPPR